ncbi:MAG: hypothetical protein HQM12_20605 [SAR324 cluster bacterium]|nr:hypothetical protein [SAR324 cluster bacterium]
MERKNCWEEMKCGREPGGEHVEEFGPCPATLPDHEFEGVNNGEFTGRFCWVIAGTLCNNKKQGTFATKLISCLKCRFLNQVHEEEGRNFFLTPPQAKNFKRY